MRAFFIWGGFVSEFKHLIFCLRDVMLKKSREKSRMTGIARSDYM